MNVGVALCLSSGCAGTTGHLAMASTRPVDLRTVDLDTRSAQHVVGRSCIQVIGVVPIGMPNLGDAVDDTLRQTGGDVLMNVVVGYDIFDIPFVYGVACYVAEGEGEVR